MFYCQITGELSNPGEKPEYVTIEKRKKEYFGVRAKKHRGKPSFSKNKDFGPAKGPIEKIGEGYEIVKQLKVRKASLERFEQEGKEIKCTWSAQPNRKVLEENQVY